MVSDIDTVPIRDELNHAEMVDEIASLRRKHNAVLLAHNYQIPDVQDIADFVGDSLGLSREAAQSDADIIVFCGVHFMAETAAILCPDKKVLIPDLEAGCSLADDITADQLREWKAEYPGAVVVSYVNTTAEVKAESDYCCTSSNALKVVEAIPPDQDILFLPDLYLGEYVRRMSGRKNMHIWLGECHVHAGIRPSHVNAMRAQHPDSDFLIHPECGCTTSVMNSMASGKISLEDTHLLSTEGMIRHAQQSPRDEFVIATEIGVLHRMRRDSPGKRFLPVNQEATCKYMKMITLEKVLHSLRELVYEVSVPQDVADRARGAIVRMLDIS